MFKTWYFTNPVWDIIRIQRATTAAYGSCCVWDRVQIASVQLSSKMPACRASLKKGIKRLTNVGMSSRISVLQVLVDGQPAPHLYRWCRISDDHVHPGHSDDYAALAEVIPRLFSAYVSYVYVYVCAYMCILTPRVHTHTHTHTHRHTHMHAWMCVSVCWCAYNCLSVCVCVCLCLCVCLYNDKMYNDKVMGGRTIYVKK